MANNPAKDKVEGKFHEVKGAVTGNKGEELKGKAQGAKADVTHEAKKTREDVREASDTETRRRP